ncbi:hypothetical protein Y032_0060g3137 [Ancylostoma ceylanicum]|uniref:Uncharacterized protein n=1 Tax=Ancylostoma ceylanicum TaxID=53326 RepID=A0A016U3R1_9BILA|nr:hypothetical protein Y032_0060g3137 [Ancylostoma ceylanicum]
MPNRYFDHLVIRSAHFQCEASKQRQENPQTSPVIAAITTTTTASGRNADKTNEIPEKGGMITEGKQ